MEMRKMEERKESMTVIWIAVILVVSIVVASAFVIIKLTPDKPPANATPTDLEEAGKTFQIIMEGIPEVGETLLLKVETNETFPLGTAIKWHTTSGNFKEDEKTLLLTKPGELKITAWIEEGEEFIDKIELQVYPKPILELKLEKNWGLLKDRIKYSVVSEGVSSVRIRSSEKIIQEDGMFYFLEPGIFTVQATGIMDRTGEERNTPVYDIVVFEDIVSSYVLPDMREIEMSRFGYFEMRGINAFLSNHIGKSIDASFDKEFSIEEVRTKFLFLLNEDRKGIKVFEDVNFNIPRTTFKRMTVKGDDGRNWIIATDWRMVLAFPDTGRYKAGVTMDTGGISSPYIPIPPGPEGPSPTPDPQDPVPTDTQGPSPDPTVNPKPTVPEPTATQGPSPDPTVNPKPTVPEPTATQGPSPPPDPQDPVATPKPTASPASAPTATQGPSPDPVATPKPTASPAPVPIEKPSPDPVATPKPTVSAPTATQGPSPNPEPTATRGSSPPPNPQDPAPDPKNQASPSPF